MIRHKKKFVFYFLAILLVVGAFWFFVAPHLAQALDTGLNYATRTGLGASDPRAIIAKIIRIILGFLGVIAVGLIIYAGFIWMTANGQEEKIENAKKIMISATIGLVVVMAGFGIATFIINKLSDATGGGSNNGSCSSACGDGQYCCNGSCVPNGTNCNNIGGGTDSFLVVGTTPAHQATNVIRNVVIRYRFSGNVNNNSVKDTTFTVKNTNIGSSSIDGQRAVNGNYIEFTPNAACDSPNETLKCFPKNTAISVEAKNGSGGILSVNGKELICGGTSRCLLEFTTGEIVDTEKPRVNITSQQVCASSNNTLRASSTDDYGVSKIDFYVANNLVGSSINNTNPFIGSPFNAETPWDAGSYQVGQTITIKATAYDLDSNNASAEKNIKLSAAHCCNGVKDDDETGVDCGGGCLACTGQACATDINLPGQCSDNMCQSNSCSAAGSSQIACTNAGYPVGTTTCCLCKDRPVIDWVSPAGGFCTLDNNKFCHRNEDCGASSGTCDLTTPNGAAGNFITIVGSGFGTARGKVFIAGVQAKLADDPTAGNPDCNTNVWKNNQIIAVVPAGANNGVISVETSIGAKDDTNDGYGSLINDFKKNTINRSGICSITPGRGKLNDAVEYNGVKLDSAKAYYGNLASYIEALSSTFNNQKQGTATVPNINTGSTTTFVSKASIESNFLPFTKEAEPYDGPIISSVEPLTGPIGQYVTIRGSGFGNNRSTSKIFFGNSASGTEADYNFPDVCSSSIWSDKQIVVKAPNGIVTNSNYKLSIKRDGYPETDSGSQQFSVTTGSPDPGVCRLQPSLGQPNTEVMLWGEYFGNKNNNSAVKFYNNVSQQSNAITFWDIDQTASGIKPWKVITTVPLLAKTGPVKLVNDSKESNAMGFIVGKCTKDSDCGSDEQVTCCATGLPEAGKCKPTAGECYGTIATSVYQWRFSTGNNNACSVGQNKCGTVCCAGPCDPVTPNKCRDCQQNQNQCNDNPIVCCNHQCNGKICPDPESCSGYSANQCFESFYCPNSPGMCSPYAGNGKLIEVGDCDNGICLNKPGCKNKKGANICHYDKNLNRCLLNSDLNCKKSPLVDGNNDQINVSINDISCDSYSNDFVWKINWSQTCPAGWVKGSGSFCYDVSKKNGSCIKCSSSLSCQVSGNLGYCGNSDTICRDDSTCDTASGKCKKNDTGRCDCCCDKTHQNQDCCTGLTCEGSCGSGGANLGLCSGCVVNGVPDDSLCNCTSSTGKYCDNSENPKGVCRDCGTINSATECSKHEACCVDGKNNNQCSGIVSGGERFQQIEGGLYFCAYYNCKGTIPNYCNDRDKLVNGVYNKLATCQQECPTAVIHCGDSIGNENCENQTCPAGMHCSPKDGCICKSDNSGAGENCSDPLTHACTQTCVGYSCMLPEGYGGGGEIGGSSANTCRCCCKPGQNPDSCKDINQRLSCVPDKEPCTSQTRGLCCGCNRDDQCGDTASTGCSTLDTCCRTRPEVETRVPSVNAVNVCRNTIIQATFNQKMDLASFSGNVWLIGNYGKASCPNDYSIVASASRPEAGRLASIIYSIKGFIVKLFPSLSDKLALAENDHLCYVKGSVIGYDVTGNKSKVSFNLSRALDSNINYYVVLQGDPDLSYLTTGNKDFYNSKISSLYKVGMVGTNQDPAPNQFNSTIFYNSYIWSFKTGNDVCLVDKVVVTPTFQLFQRPSQEGLLEATVFDRKDNPIQPIPGFYAWNWDWSSDDKDIATVTKSLTQNEGFKAVAKSGNKKDAQTLARAKATISVDTHNNPTTYGHSTEGTAELRVFLCENPWPVYYAEPPFPPGYSWPWKETSQGMEFYYCRDKGGVGTFGDLPALVNPPVNPPASNRKICMFGTKNIGKVCNSDNDCGNLPNSCLPEMLKEFFFFRENEPGIPNITGIVEPVGGKVTLSWDATTNATKYRVYYGLGSGQYILTVDTPGASGKITKTIDNLVNGLTYYFVVTALSDKNQESVFSNEISLKPADTTPPAVPVLKASGGRNTNGNAVVTLFWDKVPEAVKYLAYIGTSTGNYSLETPVINDPLPNKPNHTFTSSGNGGLNNNTDYYVAVKSVDQYGNVSAFSNEVIRRPSQPFLVSLGEGGFITGRRVNVRWLPFVGSLGYNVYYGTNIPNQKIGPINANTFTSLTGELQDGTYKFIVKGIIGNNPEQETVASNELSITILDGNLH